MKALISVEFYKLRHTGLVWAAMLIPVGMSMYLALNRNYIYDPEVVRYPWINYIGLIAMVGGVRVLAMVISFIVAYMAAMDFDGLTIQNILSVGVNRKQYFFSRLLTYLFLAFAAYGVSTVLFVLCRLYRQWEQEVYGGSLPLGEFLTVFLIVYLQFCAYCSIFHMLSFFLKKQSTTLIVTFAWIIAELMSGILKEWFFMGADLYDRTVGLVPMMVLQRCGEFIEERTIFTFDFLQCGISAILIICVTSAVGYWKFCYTDQYVGLK